MTTPSHPQPRQPRGVPGAGEFTGHNRPEATTPPLRLAPSPAAVAALAKRRPLATAPKQEPSYRVDFPAIPVRDVNLGHGIDLDLFAGQYPDLDVWTWDDDGEVVDFDPRTADAHDITTYASVISNGY